MSFTRNLLALALVAGFVPPSLFAQREFGFDNSKPSGQPYLTPEESVKRFQVPPGWEVKVFAAEPDIINPIAFTVDERGRLWVVECYEYPKRTAKGTKPRDRIKILEDTTGSGKADRVTVWAEGKDFPPGDHENGFDMASGIEVGYSGVFLGAPPYLFFLRDSKGTGKCDSREILLKGFGSEDTHETLNTFQWGPDGRLYGLHGIFTRSEVKPGEPGVSAPGVKMNAAVWRYDVPHKRFDIFADGTSNPWGMDFDSHGQCFLACCVIPHLFHMVPGGTYKRQAGASFNPYAYGLLNEICDHIHHKESGWAHAGLLVMEGDHVPEEYRGSIIMGSIHGCSIKRDTLRRNGSTFTASHANDFLVSGDKNFRPINLRWGPDGSIYVIDWHDQNPCHQAAPDSWDMTHGRIYKIQRKGAKSEPPPDLSKRSSKELVELLSNDNPWWYRTALRLLKERGDRSVAPLLQELALKSENDAHALRGLWGLHAVGAFDETLAKQLLKHKSPWMRVWAIRLFGESGQISAKMLKRLTDLARTDPAPEVRSQLASTAQRLPKQDALPLLHSLMSHQGDAHDPCLPLLIWLGYEPQLAARQDPKPLDWLAVHAPGNPLITDEIVPRAMRRLIATGNPGDLADCVTFLETAKDSAVRRRALEGLLLALQDRHVDPPANWKKVLPLLREDRDKEVQRLAGRLAVYFNDAQAVQRSLAVARDADRPARDRIEAIHDLAQVHPRDARQPLQEIVIRDRNLEVRLEACRALAGYEEREMPRQLLAGWKNYPPALKGEMVQLLSGRRDWARELLNAIGKKVVDRTEVTNNAILRIHAFRDIALNKQIESVWGRVRETPSELNALIDKMRKELHAGRGSFERGRKVFDNHCSKCHKFEGKGHEVGPNLDGAARDIEYLLVNVLDPNRVIGQPYYVRTVTLKNGRVESGLLHAEDDQAITLKAENDALKTIRKKDIDELVVQEKSIMPEGLANNMSVQDFRDLVRYVMAHPFLTEVAVAGPFAEDRLPKIDAADPLRSESVKWNHPVVGPPGRIPLTNDRGAKLVHFVASEVTAPTAMRTRLLLGTSQAVEVWVNGKPVYQGKPGSAADVPDQTGVNVELKAGRSQLLFKVLVTGRDNAIYARLLDPDRKLKQAEPADSKP